MVPSVPLTTPQALHSGFWWQRLQKSLGMESVLRGSYISCWYIVSLQQTQVKLVSPETSTARGRSATSAADFPALIIRMMFSSPMAFRLLPALRSSWINRRRVSPEAKRAWSGGKQMFAGSQ